MKLCIRFFFTFSSYLIIILFLSQSFIYAQSHQISPSNFKIISFRGEWRYGTLYIIGEIKNIGDIPAGAQVEVIARDLNKLLIDSAQFWPNSTKNIRPGSSCGIKYHITEDTRAKSIEIKVISATIWE